MRILKTVLILLAALIAFPLIIALFVKNDYVVEERIVINQPKTEVFDYIKLLKNQEHYSKWAIMDPDMSKTYRGTDGTVSFSSAWDSNNEHVGAGEQEIKKIIEGDKIDYEIRFLKPFEATSSAFMSTQIVNDDNTEVTWGFRGHIAYPFNVMMLFMDFEKMIGDDLQTGLLKLKSILENKPGEV